MDIVLLYIQLFVTFFQIGLFGFGGGYGMLSLIQTKVVPDWISTTQFTDIVAISQMTPGPIGINSATYCGYMACHNADWAHLCLSLVPALLHLPLCCHHSS